MSGLWVLAATPAPTPTPLDANSPLGSPGLLGFIVSAVLAVAVILLARSMVGHLRRVQHAPEPGTAGGSAAPTDPRGGSGVPGNGGAPGQDGAADGRRPDAGPKDAS